MCCFLLRLIKFFYVGRCELFVFGSWGLRLEIGVLGGVGLGCGRGLVFVDFVCFVLG